VDGTIGSYRLAPTNGNRSTDPASADGTIGSYRLAPTNGNRSTDPASVDGTIGSYRRQQTVSLQLSIMRSTGTRPVGAKVASGNTGIEFT
jgi:hypothetical protein